MSMKNVIKRAGIIFILGPIFIFSIVISPIIWGSTIIWAPFYYIFTGKDPLNILFNDNPFRFIFSFANWYMKNFGPKE